MDWVSFGLTFVATVLGIAVVGGLAFHLRIRHKYIPVIERIFQEKPLFIIPFGQPVEGAEEVVLDTPDGLRLKGCYLRTPATRKGVILFGLEFGSNRWACVPYCEWLVASGYDVFAIETRGQGDSPAHPGYEPLQWVTDFEVSDFKTALAYLRARSDRDPRGVGLFGLSKGGSAGLIVAASDPGIRCFVTDGAFATMGTMLPYMRQFIVIYAPSPLLAKMIPTWYYKLAGRIGIGRVARERRCRYVDLENHVAALAPRPWLMIHGGADSYIKPDMAQALFDRAGAPKELWLVEKAKHNQAMQLANGEYRRRVLDFFDRNLGSAPAAAAAPQRHGPPHLQPASANGRLCEEPGP